MVSFKKRFEGHPQYSFLQNLLRYVLENNVFQFNDEMFSQLCGIAMGTKLAPALATIYIGDLEEEFIQSREDKPMIWARYIDDVFMVWTHTREKLDHFLRDLNKQKEKIKFTAEIMTQSCNFLDLTIYKSPTFLNAGKLSTKIYYKPTNTFSYPLGSSFMPKHILKGIAIGEATRLLRNTESPALFKYYKKRLQRKLKSRKYPRDIVRLVGTMKHSKRPVTLYTRKKRVYGDKLLPFKIIYNKYKPSLYSIFRRRWETNYNDKYLFTLFPNPPMTIYRNRKSLKTLLSAKRRKFYEHKPNQDNKVTTDTTTD